MREFSIGAGVVAVIWAVVASMNAENKESVKLGTPEYEAWFQVLRDCVADAIRKDRESDAILAMSRKEHEGLCRLALTRTLDLSPGVRPTRKVSN
jgi:hypothetical protein